MSNFFSKTLGIITLGFYGTKPPIEGMTNDLLYEARKSYIEHEMAAEHHKALADMYARRIQRLANNAIDKVTSHQYDEQDQPIDMKTGLRVAA